MVGVATSRKSRMGLRATAKGGPEREAVQARLITLLRGLTASREDRTERPSELGPGHPVRAARNGREALSINFRDPSTIKPRGHAHPWRAGARESCVHECTAGGFWIKGSYDGIKLTGALAV